MDSLVSEMIVFCNENKVKSIHFLCNYARLYRMDWVKCLASRDGFNLRYMRKYIWRHSRYGYNKMGDCTSPLTNEVS